MHGLLDDHHSDHLHGKYVLQSKNMYKAEKYVSNALTIEFSSKWDLGREFADPFNRPDMNIHSLVKSGNSFWKMRWAINL